MDFSLFTYGALAAKTRASFGKLLDKKDYIELIEKKSVGEIASYLKSSTHYSSVLKETDEKNIHRGQLEKMIKTDIMNEYSRFLRFTSGDARKFLQSTYKKYETESLKIIFRRLETTGNVMSGEGSMLFLKDNTDVDFHKLLQSKDSAEFISNLKGTEYYDVLKPFAADNSQINLFNIEMILDLNYFKYLSKRMKKYLKGQDIKPLYESFGVKTDVLNLLWIYRCKKYFNMPKEIIYSYVLPYNTRIRKKTLINLIEAENLEKFSEIVRGTKYASIFERNIDEFFEMNFAEYMYKIHLKMFRRHALSISSVVDYIHMKEYELSNIVSIIEGIRYGLRPEKIKKYIVGYGF